MSGFISALIKQRKDAKKAEPDTNARLKEIIAILRKYDYDDGITPEIVVNIIEDLGPTFVKIGQIASQQPEYIPPEYCEELAKLRSKVPPMEIGSVHAQIEKYLGKPVEELFASFDDKPLGSASVAQVHKAELFDGTVVAVKVRREGVVETVARDFALIEKILDQFVKDDKGGIDIKSLIRELENTSKMELDFTNEANNLDRFWENNSGRRGIESPKCYHELTCEAVLTEDFVMGNEVSDVSFLDTLGSEERERLAALVADNFASQVLVDGFYHADPHSGNVLIKDPAAAPAQPDTGAAGSAADGEEETKEKEFEFPEHGIEWIDFGMMGSLSKKQRQSLVDIVTNVVMGDAYGLKRTVLQVAKPKGDIDHGALLETCEGMCGQYNGADFGDFDLGDLLGSVLGGLDDANFKVDPFLTNLARGIVTLEGTIKTLSPNVNILNYFTDKVNIGFDFNLDLEHPETMNPEIGMKLMHLLQSSTDSTIKTAETLDMLEKGQVKINVDYGIEDKTVRMIDRIMGYAIRGLVLAALLIGSCMLCTAPAFTIGTADISGFFQMLGCIGLIIAVFFGWRLYKDFHKGK